MADEADLASVSTEQATQMALSKRKPVERIQPTGICHDPSCQLDVEHPKLFCDGVCADRYEIHKRRQALKGRVA